MKNQSEIQFDTDAMDNISNKAKRISLSLSNTKSYGGDLLSGSLIGGGISKIDSIMQKSSNKMSKLADVVNAQKQSIFTIETDMTKEVADISIPNDFDISDFNPFNINHKNGEKEDQGKGIKSNVDIDQEKLDEYIKATEIKLENINNEGETQQQEYDDKSRIEEKSLGNINNNDETIEQTYDDNSRVKEEVLDKINKEETQQQEYDDTSKIESKLLYNINNTGEIQQQELEDNYGSNSTKLESMTSVSSNIISNNENIDENNKEMLEEILKENVELNVLE